MITNLFRLGLLVVSWASLLFYPKCSFKRYLPVTVFVTVLVSILVILSIPLKLWRVPGGTGSKVFNDFSFIFGPFFAANLWVFKLFYGKIRKYLGWNLIMDFILAFPISSLFNKLKIYELERLRPLYFFIYIYLTAISGYGFQYYCKESRR